MKKYEKEVQQAFLNNEEAVIKRLKQVYGQSLKDIEKKAQALQDDINRLGTLANLATDEEEKAKLLSMQQSKVYQRDYQKALKTQISGILDNLHAEEFKTISDYLVKCYDEGFLGAMYSLQQQGIPMCFPIDQTAMVRAVQLDSKISQGLYSRLGEDVALLKKKITAQVSRGISTGMSFQQVAQQLAAETNIGYNNAVRISRTEGHRIQIQSADNACREAKAKGADIVRQWDSTLDARTRDSHMAVDGEIREIGKPFSNGLMFPGDPSGAAAEVINCRCALLQRAKWALDEDELETLKERAAYFGLDKADTFDDYKKKYLNAADTTAKAEKDDYPVKNKFGDTIIFDEKMNSEKWSESVGYIKGLADEYETRLTAVKVGAKQAAGTVDMGGLMRLSSSDPSTAFHEFAHSIAMESLTKVGLVDDSAFWKEIRKIRTKYRKDVGDDTSRWISSYADSGNDISEFMAEAFAHAKMHQMGIPLPDKYGADFTYSEQVLAIINKYFDKKKGS